MTISGKLLAIGFAATMRLLSNYFDLLYILQRHSIVSMFDRDYLQLKTFSLHHVLRGSASTVLTATGLVNGEGQILTHRRLDTP